MNSSLLSAHEKQLFRSSERIVSTLDKAFNPLVLQYLSHIILPPAGGAVTRRGRIRIQTRETKGGALAWAVAQRIRAARAELSLTQDGLAELTGIARANIARLETGRHAPRLETINCVAKALNLEAADLLRLPEYKPGVEDSSWLNAGLDEWSGSLEQEDHKQ
jgi:transcriptional regulator with XRE-family HTH domain